MIVPRGLSLAVLFLTAAGLYAENWPGWRGPRGNGVSGETGLPVRWSATAGVRWKVPLEGAGVSNPVVWQDHIYLTSSDGRLNTRLHLYCYHKDDGRQLWHARFFGSAQPEGQFAPGGMAVPTVATDGKHVCALFGTGDLVCVDPDGKPLWVRSLAQEYGPFRNRWGMGSSPLLLDGTLIVQVDHFGQSYLLALDVATGANRWRTVRDATVGWASPVPAQVAGRTQIIAAGTYTVRGYDFASGSELWTVRGMEMQCCPTPVAVAGRVIAGCTKGHYAQSIRLDTARGDLTETHVLWKAARRGAFVPSMIAYEGNYYFVEETGFGNCLNASTGEVVWRERLSGKFSASPVAGDGKVYFANEDGVVTVVKAGPKFQVLAKDPIGERLLASPAISEGRIYLRGEKQLFCIGER